MMNVASFQTVVWNYYQENERALPWRQLEPNGSYSAYKILVSEVMLQQTQASRVVAKYHSFLIRFPTLEALANATLADVLGEWSGLGYNRRAKYLYDAAKRLIILNRQWTVDDLTSCKGIGFNTAAAVMTYAYNQPIAFIETNIRTVYIYHFFQNHKSVSDKDILEKVTTTMDMTRPREFFWALMDYGTYLKKTRPSVLSQSRHYRKQSVFNGSRRQLRGKVLNVLQQQNRTFDELQESLGDARLAGVLSDLANEGLVSVKDKIYYL